MKSSTFQKVLLGIVIAGLLFTVAHLIYDLYAYEHASIIQFIAKELW